MYFQYVSVNNLAWVNNNMSQLFYAADWWIAVSLLLFNVFEDKH